MISEITYNTRDNVLGLSLKVDDGSGSRVLTLVEMAAITRMKLILGQTTIDSAVTAGVFDWDTGVAGKVLVTLGDVTLVEKQYTAWLIVYDTTNTKGIVWSEDGDGSFTLTVKTI